jgi:hypothetical protein
MSKTCPRRRRLEFKSPLGAAASGRIKPAVNNAMAELVGAGILNPVSESKRNRAWEAVGLLDLIVSVETGSITEQGRTFNAFASEVSRSRQRRAATRLERL